MFSTLTSVISPTIELEHQKLKVAQLGLELEEVASGVLEGTSKHDTAKEAVALAEEEELELKEKAEEGLLEWHALVDDMFVGGANLCYPMATQELKMRKLRRKIKEAEEQRMHPEPTDVEALAAFGKENAVEEEKFRVMIAECAAKVAAEVDWFADEDRQNQGFFGAYVSSCLPHVPIVDETCASDMCLIGRCI